MGITTIVWCSQQMIQFEQSFYRFTCTLQNIYRQIWLKAQTYAANLTVHSPPAKIWANTQLRLRPDMCWEQQYWVKARAIHRQDTVARKG